MKKRRTSAGKRLGIVPVNIEHMRVPETAQRKFRQPWGTKLAKDLDLEKLGYPVINKVGEIYWIVDGQHRIYALKQNGFEHDIVDCEVFENMTEPEMAEVFLGRNNNKLVPVFEKFKVACTARRPRELTIYRVVEDNDLHISKEREDGCISAVGSLLKVYDTHGETVLAQTLRTIRDAYQSDRSAFDRSVIEGLGLVFNRYNGRTNEKELSTSLSRSVQGVRGLLRRAHVQRDRTGNSLTQCVAAAVVESYNKGLNSNSRKRLPSWWKQS